jgi:Mitochondrial carrier protein
LIWYSQPRLTSSSVLLFSRRIYKTQGISGLFAGSIARVSWLLPFTTIYLGVYEVSKRKLLRLKKE